MRNWLGVTLVLGLVAGCGDSHVPMVDDEVSFDADGRSTTFEFDVPAGARSVTVVVEGDDDAMYALGSLRFSDGIEHVVPIEPMEMRARDGSIEGRGADLQFPRAGTFVLQYPSIEAQVLPDGPATLVVISDGTARARVRIFAPTDEGTELHVALVSFSPAFPLDTEPAVMARVREVYAGVGVSIVVDEMVTGAERPAISYEMASPTHGDSGGRLVSAAQAVLSTDALPIVFVEHRDDAALGVSRGLPSPASPDDDFYGIIIDATVDSLGADDTALMSRIIAHELGHALGLLHLDGMNPDGGTWTDPFDDTEAFDDTIMGSALLGGPLPEMSWRVSPQQAFALRRSALLR